MARGFFVVSVEFVLQLLEAARKAERKDIIIRVCGAHITQRDQLFAVDISLHGKGYASGKMMDFKRPYSRQREKQLR